MRPTIDVFIISWTGQHDNALAIAKSISGNGICVKVIFSDENEHLPIDYKRWIRVPNQHFYGRKFQRSLFELRADVMLHICADTLHDDWTRLVETCRTTFEQNANVGIWSPDIDSSPWNPGSMSLSTVAGTSLHIVTQTDSIVWAMSKQIANRMAALDYGENNLGWGIDTLACTHAHSIEKLVVIDANLKVFHPPGSGYGTSEAAVQGSNFLKQMSAREKLKYAIVQLRLDKNRALALSGATMSLSA